LVVVATTFPRWPNDPIPRFVEHLAQEFAAQGEVTVIAPHAEGAARRETMAGLDVHRYQYFWPASKQRLAYGGGLFNNVRAGILPKLQVPFLSARLVGTVARVARKVKPDVLHAHWAIPNGLACARVAKRQKIAHVLTIHAGDVAGLAWLPGGRHLARYIVKNTDCIVAVSHHIAAKFGDLLPERQRADFADRLRVLPMGVHTRDYRPTQGKPSRNVLFIGRLVDKKGVSVLLQAFAAVGAQAETLTIAGDGPLRGQLESQAESLGIGSRVIFLGSVPEPQKIALLRARPILAVPSIETTQGDVEGLPVVVLEGLAAGCPIIASNSGGIADAVKDGENGLLCAPGDVGGLTAQLSRLLADSRLAERLAQRALETSEAYDWDRIANSYTEIYQSAINARARRT
jgi:glycosyltransferase involved in cell wall biosynthesis